MLKKVIASLAGSLYQREASPTFILQDGVLVPNETLVNARHHNGKLVFDQGYKKNEANISTETYPTLELSSTSGEFPIPAGPSLSLLVQVDESGNIVETTGNGTITTYGTVIVDHTVTHDGFGSIRNTALGSTNAVGNWTLVTAKNTYEVNDFTIEGWLLPLNVGVYTSSRYLWLGIYDPPLVPITYVIIWSYFSSGQYYFFGSFKVGNIFINTTNLINNQWYHVAFVRKQALLSLYLNGNLVGSSTCPEDSLFIKDMRLGLEDLGACCWENVRFSSSAIYTNNFTPPSRFV